MPAPPKVLPASLVDNCDVATTAPRILEVEETIESYVRELVGFAKEGRGTDGTFLSFERQLVAHLRVLGRLLILLFLTVRAAWEEAGLPARVEKDGRVFRRGPAQPRNLHTVLGVVRYFRTYFRGPNGRGFYPLDVALGLTADRFSMLVLGLAARLSTMVSYAQVHMTLGWFWGSAPSTEVIEKTVLGMGRRTGEWFEQAPAPEGDGEVLIAMFDSKGAPTATEAELERRRGPRQPNPYPDSPRHRGRDSRARYGCKPRRTKGDKSKNARMATLVVMYTLRRSADGKRLEGPIHRRVYASFAPKRHAFEIARRDANKRGFVPGSGKLIQIVTDGDEDLARYTQQYFPEALHTVDVMHVIEYLYKAGECLYREGSEELGAWIDVQKERLYGGQEPLLVEELKRRFSTIPTTGPGNKGRRERLQQAIGYLETRLPKMNYKDLLDRDLEIGSGAAEGAIKNVVGARFDFGGSRWIRERAEALLQLRCIEKNGDWDAFIQWLHDDWRSRAIDRGERIRVQQTNPAQLPKVQTAS